jgi:hypothetical protein
MAKRSVTKPRGYPDRRGMGAQSDFIVEQFVPSEQYKLQQMEMVQKLSAAGLNAEQIGKMFSFQLSCSLARREIRSRKIDRRIR